MDSWLGSANSEGCGFPLENLPYGVVSATDGDPRCAVAIGDCALDLRLLEQEGLIDVDADRPVFEGASLNAFMACGTQSWRSVREQLTDLLSVDGEERRLRDDSRLRDAALLSMANVTPRLPFNVSEYTDFYAGRQHAFNVGTMFRGAENALPPNWLHIPIGYNGRSSTVVVSGTGIRRPWGQLKSPDADAPVYHPSRRLDIELEIGAVVGLSSALGEQVSVTEADEMIFGYVLLNDWSARDIQAWEYQPLGPFQSKAFATSISPWVVTAAALEPFRTPAPEREVALLPYLVESAPSLYDIELQVDLQPENAHAATTICRTNYRHMYYSSAQQLAHHANGGCRMRTGDLLGSGTISGPERDQFGSLLEIAWGGKTPLILKTGETRTFLEDGDTVVMTGWAQGDGYRIGFGECSGTVLPAHPARTWT